MYWIMEILINCLAGLLVFVPCWLVIQKARGKKAAVLHGGLLLLLAAFLLALFSVTGLPTIRYVRLDFSMNYIPFADLFNSPIQYVLNVLLFLPFGFLLPLLWERYAHWKNLLGFGFFLTVFIEIAQVFTFRTTDIDDLITNMLGMCLGFLAVQRLKRIAGFPLPVDSAYTERSAGWEAYGVLACIFLIWFLFCPYIAGYFWDLLL